MYVLPVIADDADALKNGFQSRNIPEMQLLRLEDQKLRDLKSKLDTVKTQLKGMQTRILPELGNNLNLERMLDGVNKLTGDLENHLPCILAGAFFLLFLVLFMFEAIRRHLFSIKGKSASQGRGACKSTSRFCWGGIFCVCSGLLLVPIILLGLVGVVTVTVGGFMHAEVCPYIANSRGMRMSDYVANLKVRDVWDNVVLPQLSGGETNDFADFLNLKAPQNPLQAILIGCDPQNGEPTSKSGLLAQMGIGNLVNISAFLQKSRLTEGVNQAKKNLVDNIANANLGNEFQDDMITKLKNIIQAFQQMLKSLDLPKSINHLQISVFKTAAIESFAKNLPFNCNAQKDDLLALVRNLNESNAAMNELRSAFEGLNGNATALNSSKLEADITSLKMVSTFLTISYSKY
ncbi:unnamed protein product [Dibothriocephalus latus]|uniref:Uncharacterized protein n=1 Tax=Dibothriocephalus latus TaxID=60516 RepID=A0A3P7MCY2_DIBLA|nr:unnamed protein product [Dibothriocephalus latus]